MKDRIRRNELKNKIKSFFNEEAGFFIGTTSEKNINPMLVSLLWSILKIFTCTIFFKIENELSRKELSRNP